MATRVPSSLRAHAEPTVASKAEVPIQCRDELSYIMMGDAVAVAVADGILW